MLSAIIRNLFSASAVGFSTAHCRAHHGPRVFPVHLCSQAHVAAKMQLLCCNRFFTLLGRLHVLYLVHDLLQTEAARKERILHSGSPHIPKAFFHLERTPTLLWSGHSSRALS